MKLGEIYKELLTRDGRLVVLRPPKKDDLDSMLEFINELVDERHEDPNFGLLLDKKMTRAEEARWLRKRLDNIAKEEVIHIVAESNGKIVGSCDVARGIYSDTRHRGVLAVFVAKGWRDIGLGRELIKETLNQCKKRGLMIVELEVLSTNRRAIHLYKKSGFRVIGRLPKGVRRDGKFYDKVMMAVEI